MIKQDKHDVNLAYTVDAAINPNNYNCRCIPKLLAHAQVKADRSAAAAGMIVLALSAALTWVAQVQFLAQVQEIGPKKLSLLGPA